MSSYWLIISVGILSVRISIVVDRTSSFGVVVSFSIGVSVVVVEMTSLSVDGISVVVANITSSSLSITSGIGAVTTRVDVTFRVTTNADAVLKFVKTKVAADVVGAIVVGVVVDIDVCVVDFWVDEVVVVVVALEVIFMVVVVVVMVVVVGFGVLDTVVLVVSIFCVMVGTMDIVVLTGAEEVVDRN